MLRGLKISGESFEIPVFSGRITRRMGCTWSFQEDCIRKNMFGHSREISYTEVAEALRTRKIKITATAFRIPEKRGYISFYYAVGNSKAQEKIRRSYQFLEKKVRIQLPELSQKVIRYMDRSAFYKKDRTRCSFFMLLSTILMAFVNEESVIYAFMVIALCQYVQYSMLEFLFKGIYFGKRAEEKIQSLFAPYPHVELRKARISYVQMALMTLLTAAMNLFWLY